VLLVRVPLLLVPPRRLPRLRHRHRQGLFPPSSSLSTN
jgi:hypothetical protein